MLHSEVHHRHNGIDWNSFDEWLDKNYAKTTHALNRAYAHKYSNCLENPLELNQLNGFIKTNAIKALIVLSKFLGRFESFRYALKQNSIKAEKYDNNLNSFLRMLNAQNNNAIEWINSIQHCLRDNERIFCRFLLVSGLRTSEAIMSFNLIIELSDKQILPEYYDEDLNVLMHFKYRSFLRRSKSCYISFVPRDLVLKISKSKPLTYASIRKRLFKNNIKVLKFNLARDFFATYCLSHGLLEQEINLCQGRVPSSILTQHYWSPSFKTLRDKVLVNVMSILEQLDHIIVQ